MTTLAGNAIRYDLTHASVVFTTRQGGVSPHPYDSLNLGAYVGDAIENVERNIEILRSITGVDSIRRVRQVHGGEILDCDVTPPNPVMAADGLIGTRTGEALMVTVADCFPVALATPTKVAMLHCGWRPLAAGIVERALELLDGEPVEAAIGPGIGAANYEVGVEVASAFGPGAQRHHRDGRLDLAGIIVGKLAATERIEVAGGCTFSEPERFFSHRRNPDATGRQAGLVWRN